MNINTDEIRREIGVPEDDFSRGILELLDEIDCLRFKLVMLEGFSAG